MKTRITVTIDPQIVRRAKRIAHLRRTSVSALIEEFLRQTPVEANAPGSSFARQWAGKFHVAASAKPDARLEALKARYHLDDK